MVRRARRWSASARAQTSRRWTEVRRQAKRESKLRQYASWRGLLSDGRRPLGLAQDDSGEKLVERVLLVRCQRRGHCPLALDKQWDCLADNAAAGAGEI